VAWRRWGASKVIALEPSAAMAAQAPDPSVAGPIVRGDASLILLTADSVDVAWLSTVVHHLADLDVAAGEVRRVVRRGGAVFLRGVVPGRGRIPWLDAFPGATRARERFPSESAVVGAFERAGFALWDMVDVPEPRRRSGGAMADWVERMRSADSLLVALDDDEVAAGLAALRRRPERLLDPLTLTLLTFSDPRTA
jgi:SAM-dependent methyltransferase